jgi:hypothetical protein
MRLLGRLRLHALRRVDQLLEVVVRLLRWRLLQRRSQLPMRERPPELLQSQVPHWAGLRRFELAHRLS